MAVQREDKFEMSIDDRDSNHPESQFSDYEERPRNDSHQFVRTPSIGSTVRWPRGVDEKKLIRKIDWSIIPVLMAAYFLQFLDKVVYNVSRFYILSCLSLINYSTQMSWECRMISRCTAINSHGEPPLFS